jgi:hypothetical protein
MSDIALNSVQRQIFSASQAAQSFVCVHSKTAADVPGRNQLDPFTPGHAIVSRWDADAATGQTRLVGTLSSYPSNLLDNVRLTESPSDVSYDDPRDRPDSEHYPFRYCAPVAPGGLEAMRDFAEGFGDYQFAAHNCVDFASGAFEAATQQSILGARREGLLEIGSPRLLGERINQLNGFTPDVAPARVPFALKHDREGVVVAPGEYRSGSERYDIVGGRGDRLGFEVSGPAFDHGNGGFDLSAGSVSAGLDGRTDAGSFGLGVALDLGVSGGIYTGNDDRYGIDVPFLGGFVLERRDDAGWSAQTQVGPFDLDLHADRGVLDLASDSLSSAWDSLTSWF